MNKNFDKNKGFQLAGLMLWRLGLLLVAGTALYNSITFLLRFVDLPTQLEIGIGLLISGAVFVVVSFAMERIVDYRAEGDLSK